MRVARQKLKMSDALTVDVRTVATSTDFRALLNDLTKMARPFSVWIVRAREGET
jgi:hypothetical protein